MYEYRATIVKHVDADTTRVIIDLGLDVAVRATIRWASINAPEISTPEGEDSLVALKTMLPEGTRCILRTTKDRREKYGRYLGTFYLDDGTNMNDWLVKNGFATAYVVKEAA